MYVLLDAFKGTCGGDDILFDKLTNDDVRSIIVHDNR